MSEPTISQIAQAATALFTVASFARLYFVDKKIDEFTLLIAHEDVGLLHRMKRQEVRAGRHSDALRALGAELEE